MLQMSFKPRAQILLQLGELIWTLLTLKTRDRWLVRMRKYQDGF